MKTDRFTVQELRSHLETCLMEGTQLFVTDVDLTALVEDDRFYYVLRNVPMFLKSTNPFKLQVSSHEWLGHSPFTSASCRLNSQGARSAMACVSFGHGNRPSHVERGIQRSSRKSWISFGQSGSFQRQRTQLCVSVWIDFEDKMIIVLPSISMQIITKRFACGLPKSADEEVVELNLCSVVLNHPAFSSLGWWTRDRVPAFI